MLASAKRVSGKLSLAALAAGLAMATTVGAAQAYHPHHHHHFRGGIVLNFADGPYAYGPSCYWLKRKAVYTGSPYWWKRYAFCMGY
jgi:hypothetical protein